VQTGDVLAMATVDGPDATHPARPASATDQNRPLTTVYEPGSTNKVITVASAMELGLVNPSTVLTVPDSLRIADATFADHDPHGTVRWTVADIMRESSNVGAIEIGRMVGKDRLDASLRAFGFGSQTPIRFPGESAGLLLDPAKYTATSMGSVPVGNGLAVTAMQMLDVFVTIANDGVSRPPRLVSATIDADGTRHPVTPQPGKRVVSEATARAMRVMLTGVVTGGTGTKAAIPGYPVAGKTGTARKPPYEHPPYRYMASFAGFAPADHPRIAAIVVLDEPGTAIYGGEVAAPVFAQIMRYALRLEHVAPTTPVDGPLPRVRPETATNDVPALVSQGPSSPARAKPSGNVTGTSSPSG
jgi:cell division protein FtsI (penicillin-binding protein 3)